MIDPVFIAVIPVSAEARRNLPYTPHEQAIQQPCDGCQELCWVGPNCQKAAELAKQDETKTPYLICPACYAQICNQMSYEPELVSMGLDGKLSSEDSIKQILKITGINL